MPRSKKNEETDVLETVALLCVIIGIGTIATKYAGIFDFFQGYLSGIIFLAVGVTLFAYKNNPEGTVDSLKALLNFFADIIKGLFELIKSKL